MSRIIRILLAVAAFLFVLGLIWGIIVAVRHRSDKAKQANNPPATSQTPSIPTTLPTPVTPAPVVIAPAPTSTASPAAAPQPSQTVRRTTIVRQQTIVEDDTVSASSGDASASAWVDENGVAHAEASAD